MNRNTQSGPTFASFYDFYDGPGHREKQFAMYRSLAAEAGRSVLELACGTGIITIDLARAGLCVTGLDISAEMLAVAKEKIAREESAVQSRIRLVEGDMKEFNLNETFDMVLLPSNSFGYLTGQDDQQSCLTAVHDHLRPGGTLVIEERHYPPPVLMHMWNRRPAITAQMVRVNPATGKHTSFNWATHHVDFATQTVFSTSFIDEVQADGAVKRYIHGAGMSQSHYFTRFELQLLIEQAGFTITDLWGSQDRWPLDAHSDNMIFVANRDT